MASNEVNERLYYHATPMENFHSVYACGLTVSQDGYVHLTRDATIAVRYAALDGTKRIACFAVAIDDPSALVKIDDVGCKMFGCVSLGYPQDIKPEQIRDVSLWDLPKRLT